MVTCASVWHACRPGYPGYWALQDGDVFMNKLVKGSSNIPEMGNVNSPTVYEWEGFLSLWELRKAAIFSKYKSYVNFFFRREKSASKYFFSVGFVTVLVCGKCAITDDIRLKPLNILFSRGDGWNKGEENWHVTLSWAQTSSYQGLCSGL